MFHTCWTVLCFSYIPLKPLHAEDHHRIFFLNLKYREQSRVWLQARCWLLIRGIPERKQSARPFSWAPPVSDTVSHQPFELLISLQTWQWEGGKGAGEGQKISKSLLKNTPLKSLIICVICISFQKLIWTQWCQNAPNKYYIHNSSFKAGIPFAQHCHSAS